MCLHVYASSNEVTKEIELWCACMHAEIPLSMHTCMTLNSECSKEIKKMLLLPHKLQTVAEFKILSCNKIS